MPSVSLFSLLSLAVRIPPSRSREPTAGLGIAYCYVFASGSLDICSNVQALQDIDEAQQAPLGANIALKCQEHDSCQMYFLLIECSRKKQCYNILLYETHS